MASAAVFVGEKCTAVCCCLSLWPSLLEGGICGMVLVTSAATTTPAMAQASQRTYALKRMRKSSVVQCPEHVFCEQSITSNTAHPFCIRQYGSFQVLARHWSPLCTPYLCTTCGQVPLVSTCSVGSCRRCAC
jgi:hypothetical protein